MASNFQIVKRLGNDLELNGQFPLNIGRRPFISGRALIDSSQSSRRDGGVQASRQLLPQLCSLTWFPKASDQLLNTTPLPVGEDGRELVLEFDQQVCDTNRNRRPPMQGFLSIQFEAGTLIEQPH
jgi:hypothetical protein